MISRNKADAYLYCAMDIGKLLLESGSEVSRVEDTIRRIMQSQGVDHVEVFSITSNITATAHLGHFQTVTQTRRVYSSHTNMERIEELNQLSRDICNRNLIPEEIRERVLKISQKSPENERLMPFGYALVSACFAVFFGGNLRDMLSSAMIGFLLWYLEIFIARFTDNLLMTALIWAAAGGFLARISVFAGLGQHMDLISMGNIMLFIPGMAFTNAIRDMFVGDTITGLIRIMESILLAVILAAGFTFAGIVG